MNSIVKGNIFTLPGQDKSGNETIEILAQGSSLIERIVSYGHTTQENFWYNQENDEWVVLIQGEAILLFEDNETITLTSGDYIFIPAGRKHKVTFTSNTPPCIWIAVHGNLS